MRLRSFIVLLVILAGLVALAVAKKADRERRLKESLEQARLTFLTRTFEDDAVHTVILYKGAVPDDKKIILCRQGEAEEWIMVNRNGISARTDRVKRVVRGIENVRGELRGTSAGVFSDFGIGDDEGIHVILKGEDGREIINLVFGVKVPERNIAYCRLGGSEETFRVTSGFPKLMGIDDAASKLSDAFFMKARIYSEKVKEAGRIEITKAGEEPFALVKAEDGTWAFDPPKRRQKVDTEKVDGFLRILAEIEARDLADIEEGADYGLREPAVRVKATVPGERSEPPSGGESPRGDEDAGSVAVFDIRVGHKVPENQGMYFVQALPQDVVYHVPQNAAENLVVGRKEFVASRRRR